VTCSCKNQRLQKHLADAGLAIEVKKTVIASEAYMEDDKTSQEDRK